MNLCGNYPLDHDKEATMKSRQDTPRRAARATCLALAIVLGGLLAGCAASTGGGTTTSTGAASTTTIPAPTTTTREAETTTTSLVKLAWGGTGIWQGISITVAAPQTDPSPEMVGAGNKVVFCMVTIANNAADAFDYNGLDFVLLDTAHQEYDNYGLSSMLDLGEGSVAPGASVLGAVAFEVPLTATPSGVEWLPQSLPEAQLAWGEL
jgi:hypothetical protein